MKFRNHIYFVLLFLLLSPNLLAQLHGLHVMPRMFHISDRFDRIKHIHISNESNTEINVDSISINRKFFHLRFPPETRPPYILAPSESLRIGVLLVNHFAIVQSDTLQSIVIHNSSQEPRIEIPVSVRFFQDSLGRGTVTGKVTDEADSALGSAKLYFFYNGSILIDSAETDADGQYSKEIYKGQYTVAAEHENYYTRFYDGQDDPLLADFIKVKVDSTSEVNIQLKEMGQTDISVSGVVEAAESATKKVIIVRKGKHTPSKSSTATSDSSAIPETYVVISKMDGSYHIKNILESGYYYIQALSNYNLPCYFNEAQERIVDWQLADQLLIDQHLIGKNIFLQADSLTGGGSIEGKVLFQSGADSTKNTILLARSLRDSTYHGHHFRRRDKSFRLEGLSYGDYRIVAKQIGVNDIVSQKVTINEVETEITGVTIVYSISGISDEEFIPSDFVLGQNYPNPFNPETTIEFSLSTNSKVKLNIYNILGEKIATLFDETMSAGIYRTTFNASGLPSGIYIYEFRTPRFRECKKMILLK